MTGLGAGLGASHCRSPLAARSGIGDPGPTGMRRAAVSADAPAAPQHGHVAAASTGPPAWAQSLHECLCPRAALCSTATCCKPGAGGINNGNRATNSLDWVHFALTMRAWISFISWKRQETTSKRKFSHTGFTSPREERGGGECTKLFLRHAMGQTSKPSSTFSHLQIHALDSIALTDFRYCFYCALHLGKSTDLAQNKLLHQGNVHSDVWKHEQWYWKQTLEKT